MLMAMLSLLQVANKYYLLLVPFFPIVTGKSAQLSQFLYLGRERFRHNAEM
jgi:hypothetical protein